MVLGAESVNNSVFDRQEQRLISDRRKEFLGRFLQELIPGLGLKTALDSGCGIGFFSEYLSSLGLRVAAFDAREENIAEAKRRYPKIEFCVRDVEDRRMAAIGEFDLVLCFGLLYHLENPFRAIRNLHAVTGKALIIESIIPPSQSPIAVLIDEPKGEDQGLHYIAFLPSEACLVKMLYNAGFSEVYKTASLPDHKDFRGTLLYKRRRTVLVASNCRLQSPNLILIPEPRDQRQYIWDKGLTRLPRPIQIGRILLSKTRYAFGKIFSRLPLPVHVPEIGWWLTWNDVMGKHIRLHDKFEQGEQIFLLRFLKPGMIFLDVGAHHGLYTLLASKKVGKEGRVIAFEPSQRELRRLRWHLALNRCRNVHVEPVAVGDTEGTAELFVCLGKETGCNSLRRPAVSERLRKVEGSITTLDRSLHRAGIDKVDFIKLDVEGAELEVLKGASGLLANSKPVILCELADVRTKPWRYSSVQIYDFLTARDYRWFSVTPEGNLRPCPRKAQYHENLIGVPGEKIPALVTYIEENRQ